jgi:hypothetical protein
LLRAERLLPNSRERRADLAFNGAEEGIGIEQVDDDVQADAAEEFI